VIHLGRLVDYSIPIFHNSGSVMKNSNTLIAIMLIVTMLSFIKLSVTLSAKNSV
jgi:hypothetical protein